DQIDALKKLIDKLNFAPTFRQLLTANVTCVLSTVGVANIDNNTGLVNVSTTLLDAFQSCFSPQAYWDVVAGLVQSGAISGDTADSPAWTSDDLPRYFWWGRVGQIAVPGTDSWISNAGGASAGLIGISYTDAKPAHDSQGRTVFANCLHQHLYSWVIDEACQDSHFAFSSNPPNSGGGASGLPRGVILKTSTGTDWFYNSDTKQQFMIPDQATYACLTKYYI